MFPAPRPPTPGAPPPDPRGQATRAAPPHARWRYVNDQRSHEVFAGIVPAPQPSFFVVETLGAWPDPANAIESAYPIAAAWEAKLHHMELEVRLAMIGSYWRHDIIEGGPWTRVQSLGAAADLRPVQDQIISEDLRFYVFHHRTTGAESILVELPRTDGIMIARLDFPWPDAEQGAIRILARAAQGILARSILAREHMDLQARGHEKLVFTQDFLRAHKATWRLDIMEACRTMLTRLSEWRLPKPGVVAATPEPSYTDFLASLSDPRVLALHQRFLVPGEEADLLRAGEPFIRRAMQIKRTRAPREDQLMLNVLEASLLARAGLAPGQRATVDPEVAAMIRRFAYYL